MITKNDILKVQTISELNSLMDRVAKEHNCTLDDSLDYKEEAKICEREADIIMSQSLYELSYLLSVAADRFDELDK